MARVMSVFIWSLRICLIYSCFMRDRSSCLELLCINFQLLLEIAPKLFVMDVIEKLSLKLVNDYAQCSDAKDISKLLKTYLQGFEENADSIHPAWPTGDVFAITSEFNVLVQKNYCLIIFAQS